MSYLEEFQYQINHRDFHKFFQLWEEYCTNDQVDVDEFLQLLEMIKQSDFAKLFGQFVETALPLWNCVDDEKDKYEILKRLIDLENTHPEILGEAAYQALENKFGDDPKFRERIRQVGLRTRESFQGAISNYELLVHLQKGNFVYHTGGWGTGEVMEVSPIREQAAIEFENVTGIKHINFENAFKTLIPLQKDHFLAQRFADPDLFEEYAKKNPVDTIKILLRDLGPKTAGEIKEELCDLVIPDKDWSKWWQSTRAKLKKNTMIESPSSMREPFQLRKTEVSHEERLNKEIEEHTNISGVIQTSYTYARDLPHMFRKPDVKEALKEKLIGLLTDEELTEVQELQIYIFLESMFGHKIESPTLNEFVQNISDVEQIVHDMDIVAFKKRMLVLIKECRDDWKDLFFSLFYSIQQNQLRDFILNELNKDNTRDRLVSEIQELFVHPEKEPEIFLWYFQKLAKKGNGGLPYTDKEGQCRFLEAFLILMHKIEHDQEYRDLTKKMYQLLTAKRFAVIRAMIEKTSLEFIKEFLLLVSKCHTFNDHDQKILRSLAQVVHPSLAPSKKAGSVHYDNNVLWTTEEGYLKTQERLKQIATVEMVENAKEVEAARALGDLRENAEYKFAVERRSRLQGEMKTLGKMLNQARIITKDDILLDEIGVGNTVTLQGDQGKEISYTILGPWDANPDEFIISYQSQLAQAMAGKKVGDNFVFRDEPYKVVGLKSFLD